MFLKSIYDGRNCFDEKIVQEETLSKSIKIDFCSFCSFFFSVLMKILVQFKCVQIFIEITGLMDFNENFDAYALTKRP